MRHLRYATATTLSAALLAALGALAACGGTPVPIIASSTPPVSAPASPSASTRPTPPLMPDAAKQHTKAGAIAFVKYVVNQLTYASETLDTTGLRATMSANCSGCQTGIKALDEMRTKDAKSKGGIYSLTTLSLRELAAADQAGVEGRLTLRTTTQTVIYPGGKNTTYAGGKTKVRMVVHETDAAWIVTLWEVD